MFNTKKGFDILIANPPYLKERDNKAVFDIIAHSELGKTYHEGKMDYWYYFLHRALDISHDIGTVAFITSRYWINSSGSKKLIRRIRSAASFVSILDIGDLTVFENVAGHHMVHVYSKQSADRNCTIRKLKNTLEDLAKEYDTPNLQIIRRQSSTLFRDEHISVEPAVLTLRVERRLEDFFKVFQGVVQNPDKVSSVAAEKYKLPKGEGVFVLTKRELDSLTLTDSEEEFVKPFYDEAAVQRYYLLLNRKNFLFYLTKKNCPNLRDKPNIRMHLSRYREIMLQRRETKNGTIEWFHLHWPRDPEYFESEKIIMPSMFNEPRAAYVTERAYVGMGSNVIVAKTKELSLKWLVGILNSRMAGAWFRTNGKHRGVGVDIGVEKLRGFPLPIISSEQQIPLVSLVDRIFAAKRENEGTETTKWEQEIDRLVYDLYGLTKEEIAIVEGRSS